MEKHEHFKLAAGVATLFITITSIFSLISKLITCMLVSEDLQRALSLFLKNNYLWLIVVVIIIFLLITYLKKYNLNSLPALISNETIRLTAGLLIALEGIIHLSNLISIYFISLKSYNLTKQLMDTITNEVLKKPLISNGISIFIFLCQIFIGIYLVKFYKEKIKN